MPNEHGTWQYGRNGWCDGQKVKPWVVDVTKDLIPGPEATNTIEYRGLYQGPLSHHKKMMACRIFLP